MKRNLFIAVIFLAGAFNAAAQTGVYTTNNKGSIYREHDYAAIDGDPYIFDSWKGGKATTDKDVVYDNLQLKYNIHDDEVIFKEADGDAAKSFGEPIKSFVIINDKDLLFKNGYPAIEDHTTNSYYQVVADGKCSLLKKNAKTVMENKAYGFTVQTKRFINDDKYYIYRNNAMMLFKPNKSNVLSAMADKQAEISAYLKGHSVNFKNDDDLGNLFNYYDSLK